MWWMLIKSLSIHWRLLEEGPYFEFYEKMDWSCEEIESIRLLVCVNSIGKEKKPLYYISLNSYSEIVTTYSGGLSQEFE